MDDDQLDTPSLDELLDRCSQRARSLQALLAPSPDESNDLVAAASVTAINEADAEFRAAYNELVPALQSTVAKVAARRRLSPDRKDDLEQEAWLHVRRVVGKYRPGNGVAWLYRIINHLAFDSFFRKRGPDALREDDVEDEVAIKVADEVADELTDELTDRPPTSSVFQGHDKLPERQEALTPALREQLRADAAAYWTRPAPKLEYKYLFLFGTGLLPYCSESHRAGRREPTAWERSHLNSLGRFHQVAFDWADRLAAEQLDGGEFDIESDGAASEPTLVDMDRQYGRLLAAQRQKICHTLSRYYWAFLLLPSVWRSTFGRIPPREDAALPPRVDAGALVRLLQFDGWMAIPGPRIFEDWLEAIGLACDLRQNFLMITRLPIRDSKKRDGGSSEPGETPSVNSNRDRRIEDWFGHCGVDFPSRDELKDTPFAELMFGLNLASVAARKDIDLPLPFYSDDADAIHN